MLLFKKKFLEPIRRGEKTQTIRFWNYRRMKPGQRSYVPGIGYIAIISVEPIELSLLTDADALLDGFPTAELLRAEIRSLYTAEALATQIPYRIRFSVYPQSEQKRIKKEQQKKKQNAKLKINRDRLQSELVAQNLDKLLRMCKVNKKERPKNTMTDERKPRP